jgi:uncharacterized protein (DUF952 family)
MIPHSSQQQARQAALRHFRVRLGHSQVLVQGENITEAIRRARTQFSHEMPRLWDKIHLLDEGHFKVEML